MNLVQFMKNRFQKIKHKKKISQLSTLYDLLRQQWEQTIEAHATHWVLNLRLNAPFVSKNILNYSISREKKTCCIFAAGASLEQYEDRIHRLKQKSEVFIIASPTVIPWMMKHNCAPDIVIAVDKHENMYSWLKLSDWNGPVILPTIGNTKVASHYDIWWFNITMGRPGYIPLIDAVTKVQYPELPSFPSLGHVTAHALQIMIELVFAKRANFERYVLCGADYGYWNDKARIPIINETEVNIDPTEMIEINGVKTNYKMALYKERLYAFWEANPIPLYSLSDGLLHEIPKVSLYDILASRFPFPTKKEAIAKYHMEYLTKTLPESILPKMVK